MSNPIDVELTSKRLFCPYCGTEIPEEANFCCKENNHAMPKDKLDTYGGQYLRGDVLLIAELLSIGKEDKIMNKKLTVIEIQEALRKFGMFCMSSIEANPELLDQLTTDAFLGAAMETFLEEAAKRRIAKRLSEAENSEARL